MHQRNHSFKMQYDSAIIKPFVLSTDFFYFLSLNLERLSLESNNIVSLVEATYEGYALHYETYYGQVFNYLDDSLSTLKSDAFEGLEK